jgi:prepilin-type N-terminal cleavage/methylation domain-containing protein
MMNSIKPTTKLSSAMGQKGFSLIEVLVTMVILAFGLLGVAGLLVGGVSNAAGSEAFSKASQLAAQLLCLPVANTTWLTQIQFQVHPRPSL